MVFVPAGAAASCRYAWRKRQGIMHEGLFSRRLKCCRMWKSDNIWEGVISGWGQPVHATQLQFQEAPVNNNPFGFTFSYSSEAVFLKKNTLINVIRSLCTCVWLLSPSVFCFECHFPQCSFISINQLYYQSVSDDYDYNLL